MRYKKFQKAGVLVSELGIGTWALSGDRFGPVDRRETDRAIHSLFEKGVNLIDTAPVYGNGTSEKFVGELLRDIPRDKVLLSTKFGSVPDYRKGIRRDASYRNVMREIESSLLNLKTDYIDFYFIHWPDIATPIEETMAALNLLRKEGKIRFIGVSNFSIAQIQEAQKYGEIDVQEPPFSMLNQTAAEVMKWGYGQGIDSMTYGSMGAGILSGAIRSMPVFDQNDARVTFYDYYKEPKFSKVMELLTVMDRVAQKHDRPVAQVALNWSTRQEFVGAALVGVKDEAHAEMNAAAFEWELDAEDMAMLNDKLKELGFDNGEENK